MSLTAAKAKQLTAAHDELPGSPASGGRATGPVRIVRGDLDEARLRPGDIVVCADIRCARPSLLAVAAGIVTENGGALANPAIVAREYKIPAVLGVGDATTVLRDGQHVTIDGTTGVVYRSG